MSENALILHWPHPSDTVRSLALALADGLSANGLFLLFPDRTYLDIVQDIVGNNRCIYFPYAGSHSKRAYTYTWAVAKPYRNEVAFGSKCEKLR
jgi:hypothetical protein